MGMVMVYYKFSWCKGALPLVPEADPSASGGADLPPQGVLSYLNWIIWVIDRVYQC